MNFINIALFVLIIINIISLTWLIKSEIRLKKFFSGNQGNDLEDVIKNIINQLKDLDKSRLDIFMSLENIESRLNRSIRGLHAVRFNPFKDTGGNQSFAIALLDENKNGVIISSLYSRERMTVFAKPINSGVSEYELTKEEKEAYDNASIKL